MNKLNVLLLSILVFSLLSFKLTQPFWGHHEFNGVYYGMIAKNYLRYGLIETKGGQVNNLWPTEKANRNYHVNHPATYPLSLAILFKIFGEQEFVARLFSITASVLGIYVLAKLLILVFDNKFVWLAVIPILFTPLFRYYGSLPVFEPILFPLIVWGLYLYWKNQEGKQYKPLIIVCFLAMLVDWPGFWLPAWLLITEIFTKKRKGLIISLFVSIISSFVIILLMQFLAAGSVNEIFTVGKYRLQTAPYTSFAWIRLLISRARAFLGDFILFSSLIGTLILYRKKGSVQWFMVLASLGIGLTHIFVFRNITWYHDYMLYHLLPFLAIAMGGFLSFLDKIRKSNSLIIITVLVITALTYIETKRFFIDLSQMQGYKDCIEMGKKVRKSNEKLTFQLNSEKAKECPPFIGFYGEKPFAIEIFEDEGILTTD